MQLRKSKIVRTFFNVFFRLRPPELVQYWKTGDMARAKLTILKDGSYAMIIEGEKYPLYGFPRGPVLFGPLARLKYMIKNYVFNQPWKLLEEGKTNEEIGNFLYYAALPEILKEIEKNKYDFFPPERMCPAVRELWRAMTVIEKRIGAGREEFELIKQGLTFFFQEDDAYRFRFQWLSRFANPKSTLRKIYRFITGKKYSLRSEVEALFNFLENAEIVGDMKGRTKLIKRIVLLFLDYEQSREILEAIAWELDWNKLKLSRSDTYYFRGKYFKVDFDKFDY